MPDTFKNFVAGQWKDSNTGQTFENENPANKGSNLGFFQSSGTVDIDEAVSAAELAFRTINAMPTAQVEAADISNAVLWLASDESRCVTGTTQVIDAGATAPFKIPHP